MSAIAEQKTQQAASHPGLWKTAWDLSWPLVIDAMAISLAFLADTWVAGKLGPNAQPAIAVGGQIWCLMLFLAMVLSVGTNALVSRSWGARDLPSAVLASRQSILSAIMLGFISTGLGLLSCHSLLSLLGAPPAVAISAWEYLRLSLPAMLPLTILWACHSIFQAHGDTRTPMVVVSAMAGLVCFLDLALCLTPLRCGIAGIGLSWLIASTCACLIALLLLKRSALGSALDGTLLRTSSLSTSWLLRLLKIGVPACLQDLSWVFGNFVLLMILGLSIDPPAAEASWGIGARLEDVLAIMPVVALSMAAGTIVGQHIGANEVESAERAGWQLSLLSMVFCILVGAIMFFFAAPIASCMSTSQPVRMYSAQYLQLAGLSEPFLGVWLVLLGALQGAGFTIWPMVVSGLCLMVIRLPLAYFLTVTLHMGPLGTWIAAAVACVLGCLWMLLIFRLGKWKAHKI